MISPELLPDAPFAGFAPWIGPNYDREREGSPRTLMLGESHWGTADCRYREFTRDVVRRHVFEGRDRFFTKIAKLVLGLSPGGYLSAEQYHSFWNRVVFSNFVQDLAGPAPRCRPSPEKWETGRGPFERLLVDCRPEIVVVLGKELWANLPPSALEDRVSDDMGDSFAVRRFTTGPETTALAAFINHPSSRGWTYREWQPRIRYLLDARDHSYRPRRLQTSPDQA